LSNYRCTTCGEWIRNSWDGYDVRVDYRRLANDSHVRVWRERVLCQACAQKEWDAHDNPSGAQQGDLFAT
jgi:DNA-directed RNA polymerase subunit N (RpoN/RPB10)